MELFDIIAQIIGILAMAFNILSYQQKTRAQAIAFQLAGGLLFSINFFMLGAIVGAVLNAVAVVRAIIFLNKDRLRADRLPWLIGFISVFILTYILTFTLFDKEPSAKNLILESLPVIGMTATTISFRFTDAGSIRKYGLISSPAWLIYNVANLSVGAILCETFSLCSILIGMLRFDKKSTPAP